MIALVSAIADRLHSPGASSSGWPWRVLANRPSLILADESTAALDSQRGHQVMELFRKVAQEQNGAVILATHDHRALDVFDTIYEMEDGMIRKQNRPAH